jgi:hypothetical protein
VRKTFAFALIIALMGVTMVTEAQVGGFLKDKAQKAVVKSLKSGEDDKRIEEQQQEQPEKQEKKQPSTADQYMQQKMMPMGFKNVKFDPAYSFSSSMEMDVETVDSASTEVNRGAYAFYFDKNSQNFAMEFEALSRETGKKEKSLMIFDFKNKAMLILADKDGEKSGIAMNFEPDSIQQEKGKDELAEPVPQEDLSVYNMNYKATGRTKNVLGYKCKEYVYENSEGKVELWATNDIKYNYSEAFGHMNGFQYLATGGTAYLLGTVLEMHFKDANSNARADFWVKEFNPSFSRTLSVTDYQVVGLGNDKK